MRLSLSFDAFLCGTVCKEVTLGLSYPQTCLNWAEADSPSLFDLKENPAHAEGSLPMEKSESQCERIGLDEIRLSASREISVVSLSSIREASLF